MAIVIPVEIAFNPESLNSSGEIAVEAIINAIFFIDIFLNFRTTFISPVTGDEIFDLK